MQNRCSWDFGWKWKRKDLPPSRSPNLRLEEVVSGSCVLRREDLELRNWGPFRIGLLLVLVLRTGLRVFLLNFVPNLFLVLNVA